MIHDKIVKLSIIERYSVDYCEMHHSLLPFGVGAQLEQVEPIPVGENNRAGTIIG